MIIDSHQHFWKFDQKRYSWIDGSMDKIRRDFLPSDLLPVLKANHVDACIAVQADQSEEETEFLLNLATHNEFVKGVVGWVDLSTENVEERLYRFGSNSYFKGVRHTEWDKTGGFMLDLAFQNGISILNQMKLTFNILVFDYQLASAVQLVEKFPEQKFVLDHMGKPDFSEKPSREWTSNIQELARFAHVNCKISGFFSDVTVPGISYKNIIPFLEIVTEAFGEDRLLFGSDWPMCLLTSSYGEGLELIKNFYDSFSDKQLQKIMALNAIRIYDL